VKLGAEIRDPAGVAVIRYECSACEFGINAYEGRFGPQPKCSLCGAAMLVSQPGDRAERGVGLFGRKTAGGQRRRGSSEPVAAQPPSFYLRLLIGLGAAQLAGAVWWLIADSGRSETEYVRLLVLLAAYPIQGSVVGVFAWWRGRGVIPWSLAGGFFFLPCLLALGHLPALCRRCGGPLSRGDRGTECPECGKASR
jgi:hypothetical protein